MMGIRHWALLAGIIGGFSTALAGMESWSAVSPVTVAGFLASLASSITAVFVSSPSQDDTNVKFR
jgi:hypothetical protein